MDDATETVLREMDESIALKRWVRNNLAATIALAAKTITASLRQGGKVLFCGNGGSAADAQHLAAELIGRFAFDRRPLPALALTTDTSVLTAVGNDYGFDLVFARQLEALAAPPDVVCAISTSGNSPNLIRGVEVARSRGVKTIALLGRDGGRLSQIVDLALVVPGTASSRIQECQITIGHIICGLVESELFGTEG